MLRCSAKHATITTSHDIVLEFCGTFEHQNTKDFGDSSGFEVNVILCAYNVSKDRKTNNKKARIHVQQI